MKENLLGSTLSRLEEVAAEAGLPAYAGRQLADWIYRKGVSELRRTCRTCRCRPRARASRSATRWSGRRPVKVTESTDGTKKYLFAAGQRRFRGGRLDPRGAAGHPLPVGPGGLQDGLPVLHDGQAGFPGAPVGAGQILNQYLSLPERDRVTNIVYMGMGEPLDNLANVLASLEILCSDYGLRPEPDADHGLHDRPGARDAHLPGQHALPPRREPAHAVRGGAAAADAHRERPSSGRRCWPSCGPAWSAASGASPSNTSSSTA